MFPSSNRGWPVTAPTSRLWQSNHHRAYGLPRERVALVFKQPPHSKYPLTNKLPPVEPFSVKGTSSYTKNSDYLWSSYKQEGPCQQVPNVPRMTYLPPPHQCPLWSLSFLLQCHICSSHLGSKSHPLEIPLSSVPRNGQGLPSHPHGHQKTTFKARQTSVLPCNLPAVAHTHASYISQRLSPQLQIKSVVVSKIRKNAAKVYSTDKVLNVKQPLLRACSFSLRLIQTSPNRYLSPFWPL